MDLNIIFKTSMDDIVIDFVGVRLKSGEEVSLNWDESGVSKTHIGFEGCYSGVYFDEDYADGRIDELEGLVITDYQLFCATTDKEYTREDVDSGVAGFEFEIVQMKFVDAGKELSVISPELSVDRGTDERDLASIIGNSFGDYIEERDYSRYDHMSFAELKEEQEEIRVAISNERLWQKGSDDFDSIWMHEYNMANLDKELEYVSEKMEDKFLAAVEYFSKELGSKLDPESLSDDELVYCFENKMNLIDYDFWVQYETLVGESLTYEEYHAIDIEFDGDPHDIELDDVVTIEAFKDSLHRHRMSMFVFDDELYFGQDKACESVDGYIWATDDLVERMKKAVAYKHDPEEMEGFDNINFYPIYNCWSCTAKIEGTYYYDKNDKEVQGEFTLLLSDDESAALIDAMEAYCEKTCGCSCTAKLNEIRVEEGLAELCSAVRSVESGVRSKGVFSPEDEKQLNGEKKSGLDEKIGEAKSSNSEVLEVSSGHRDDVVR